jgi:hypothetical protein
MFSTSRGPSTDMSYVVFCPTARPHKPIRHRFATALGYGQIALSHMSREAPPDAR